MILRYAVVRTMLRGFRLVRNAIWPNVKVAAVPSGVHVDWNTVSPETWSQRAGSVRLIVTWTPTCPQRSSRCTPTAKYNRWNLEKSCLSPLRCVRMLRACAKATSCVSTFRAAGSTRRASFAASSRPPMRRARTRPASSTQGATVRPTFCLQPEL